MQYTDEMILQLITSVIRQQDTDMKGTPELSFDSTALTEEQWSVVYQRLREHKILPLFTDAVSRIPGIPQALADTWKKEIYAHTYHAIQLQGAQKKLLGQLKEAGIPVVVMKGTAAARYYAALKYRTMGDVDLLTLPERYEEACTLLGPFGWEETSTDGELKRGRHRSFQRGDIEVEMHRFFATQKDQSQADCLDGLLYDAIRSGCTDLTDTANGLVILEHISQHMNGGIGLRQIIDWRMFVERCLDDAAWEQSFRGIAQETGLEKLAINAARMCQKYLGLRTDITWCSSADEKACDDMMQYVMNCGNFGHAQDALKSGEAAKVPSIKHPIRLFRYLQERGEANWGGLKKHKWLKPFAWLYQICHYIVMLIQLKATPGKLRDSVRVQKAKDDLLHRLGVPNVVPEEEDLPGEPPDRD